MLERLSDIHYTAEKLDPGGFLPADELPDRIGSDSLGGVPMSAPAVPPFWKCLAAECVGTFLLIFLGLGAVHSAVATGALTGLWQVAVVWGISIMVAIYTIGSVSGAHINPAITIALATWNLFPRTRVGGYILAQLVGAFAAAALLYALFWPFLADKERAHGVTRGTPESIITAMCYGEYYPNPGSLAVEGQVVSRVDLEAHLARYSEASAFLAELAGTAILAFMVVGITSRGNHAAPDKLSPAFIGLTVSGLICVLAPLTQACFNPARDFGPRLFAWVAGWGSAAIPGPNGRGFFTVYIVAPVLGAIVGAGVYQLLFLQAEDSSDSDSTP